MKNSRKTLAGITAFAFMLALASCSSDENSDSNSSGGGGSASNNSGNSTPVTAQEVMNHAYKAIELEFDVPYNYIDKMQKVGSDGKIFISGSSQDEANMMYIADSSCTEFTKVDFKPDIPENADYYYNPLISNDGTIYIIVSVTTYGDMELPDWDDPDFDSENFDWDAFYEAAESSYFIYNIDLDGNIISQNEITGLDEYMNEDDNIYLGDICICGSHILASTNSSSGDNVFVQIGADGVIGDEVELEDDDVYNIYNHTNDADGNLYYSSWNEDGIVIKKMDAQTLEVSDYITLNSNDVDYINTFFAAEGDYCFYISDSLALYGLKEDGTTEEVVNWLDSDLNGDYIGSMLPIENNEFIIYERNWSNNSKSLYRLTERDISELENIQVLTMVVQYDNTNLMSKVNEFNKSNDQYRIKVENYNKYYEFDDESNSYLNSPMNQLKLDIAAGKTFDIIAMSSDSSNVMNSLSKKGIMTDLYQYMGKNGTVSKDDILPNILEAGEYDGKLCYISPSFSVQTMAVKSKFCDKENWTIQDLMDTYNNAGDGMKVFRYSSTKSDVLDTLITTGGFIDFNNAECHFDSPEFVQLLEFCDSLEDFAQPDWNSMDNDEMQAYWEEQDVACRNDKALIETTYFYSGREYTRMKYVTFDDDICLVGMPSNDGCGAVLHTDMCFSIMEKSNNKDAAWEFISTFFNEDYQSSDNMYSFPALKSAFETELDECMENPYYVDSDGKKQEYDDAYWVNGESITIPNLTQQERDDFEKYLLSAKSVVSDYYFSGISDIIQEESEAFFNGERSAQEAADIMQNRLSILVSEQY